MKSIAIVVVTLTASLASTLAFAHIGDHHQQPLISGLMHLITEHALPIGVIGGLAAGLLVKQLWST
jgi:hypothetical protein